MCRLGAYSTWTRLNPVPPVFQVLNFNSVRVNRLTFLGPDRKLDYRRNTGSYLGDSRGDSAGH